MIKEITHLQVASNYYLGDMGDLNFSPESIRVSGSLEKYYSPAAKLFLDQTPKAGQGLIAMSEIETPLGVIRLARPKTHFEYAQMLYESLRTADARGLSEVIAVLPLGEGIAIAIRDHRLKRAANGR